VPCIELAHLTPTQKKAYILADNKIALNAGWDDELLRVELGELDKMGFNLELTGFNLLEMANIFDNRVISEPESSAKEITTDDYKMDCTCPRCGFEFDNKNA
jgi:hypothetical protein